jgi:hypothetical protein
MGLPLEDDLQWNTYRFQLMKAAVSACHGLITAPLVACSTRYLGVVVLVVRHQ